MAYWVSKHIKEGGVTSPQGFKASGVACGLKPNEALDLSLVTSDTLCAAAGVFTTNVFQAAPVAYDRALIESRRGVQAVVINTGSANACTGNQGKADVLTTVKAAGELLGIDPETVLVMSTGVIGKPLPMDKLIPGLRQAAQQLAATDDAALQAARAIMTTDTHPKQAALKVTGPTGDYTIAGMVKGAGMIEPHVATMLCLITTDAPVTQPLLQIALAEAAGRTFNCITIDGDMSTNDTVLVLANGASGISPIDDPQQEAYDVFADALETLMLELAQAVVRDGEGATRFITIEVQGARDRAQAHQVGKAVANSKLVKTAIYGQDANWGRIVCAAGYSQAGIAPETVSVWLGDQQLVREGAPYEIDEERSSALLAKTDIDITIDLGQGEERATIWTCDLTHRYIDINAHYRS
ncbi:MAG: bifunctional glutamate N-acetyltransferase/amino-acid acetyltransferase ArgJ [Chloroflexi bacterium]|nr:bifunctional glutamate N-acetyltransferase/amino-acid acetyltransferase ArgJ [Chloroflexota bacterium]